MTDWKKARLAEAAKTARALAGDNMSSGELFLPNDETIKQFGTPTNMTPAQTDIAFGYLRVSHLVEKRANRLFTNKP